MRTDGQAYPVAKRDLQDPDRHACTVVDLDLTKKYKQAYFRTKSS